MGINTFWLDLLAKAYQLWSDLRVAAKGAGITDEQLDAITADYDKRIAERKLDA